MEEEHRTVLMTTEDVKEALFHMSCFGTEEGIEKIERYIEGESNYELRRYANECLGDAESEYYAPQTTAERRDYFLAQLANEYQDQVWELIAEDSEMKNQLIKLDLEKQINSAVLSEDQLDILKKTMRFSRLSDRTYVKKRIEEIPQEVLMFSKRRDEARRMIVIEKYKLIPGNYFERKRADDFFIRDEWDDIGQYAD